MSGDKEFNWDEFNQEQKKRNDAAAEERKRRNARIAIESGKKKGTRK